MRHRRTTQGKTERTGPLAVMTTIHDTIRALLVRRTACVDEVTAIDQELVSVQTTVTDAIAQLTPLPAPPTNAQPPASSPESSNRPASAPPAADRSHDQARRTAALGIRFEREIKTALVAGPITALDIAKKCGTKHKDIKQSLKRLFAAGTIRKIGARGPAVKWELAGAVSQTPRRATAPATSSDREFETVFPSPANPKASPREAIEGARA